MALICSAFLVLAASVGAAQKKRYPTGTSLAFINSVRISGTVGSPLPRCDRGATVHVLQRKSASDPTVVADLGTDVSDRRGHWGIQLSAQLHDATISVEIQRRAVRSAGRRVICQRGVAVATFPG
jgi:hypothetical protein